MAVPLRVLIVEDSADDAALLVRELRRGGYDVTSERVDSSGTMSLALEQQDWDLVVSDYSIPGFSGSQALKLLRSSGSSIPFIFLSGTIGEDAAVDALKQGAQDYIMKHNLKRLLPAIQRELREAELLRERNRLERQFRQVQKMEAVGRLAAGVAHDFNNLVMIITSYTAMLMERALSDDVRRYTEQVQQAANRAAALTRQLLAFSRKEESEPRSLDLNLLVQDMCKLLPPLLGGGIEIEVVTGPLSGCIKVDQANVEQVLLNL
ncbi:MAG: response regulator, partial [Acidobacteria bacterium]|nr:response regulator [Acidobacteriota bacterium]